MMLQEVNFYRSKNQNIGFSNCHNESMQSIAQELADNEQIVIRNNTTTKSKTFKI